MQLDSLNIWLSELYVPLGQGIGSDIGSGQKCALGQTGQTLTRRSIVVAKVPSAQFFGQPTKSSSNANGNGSSV